MKIPILLPQLRLSLTLTGLVLACLEGRAEKIQGAAAVLQRASEQTNSAPKEISSSAKLKQDIEAFQKQSSTLPPDKVAAGWLLLCDRFGELNPAEMYSGDSESRLTQKLFEALPPPEAWGELLKQVESRPPAKGSGAARDVVLRLLVHTLNNLPEAQRKDVAEIEALVLASSEREARPLLSILEKLDEALIEASDDPQAVARILDRQLKQAEASDYRQEIRVPDLISLLGQEKAEAFLRRALVKNVQLQVYEGQETVRLARKIALELVDNLKKPQWSLTESLDATSLYEAMEKKFGQTESETNTVEDLVAFTESGGNYEKVQAQTYYLLGLIVANRNEEAVALAQKLGRKEWVSLPHEALKDLEQAGHTRAIYNFFKTVVTKHPEMPFWDQYIELAAKVGETDSMLELVQKVAADANLNKRKRKAIEGHLPAALLAADRIEEGAAALRKTIATGLNDKDTDVSDAAMQLARLGALLGRAEWLAEGVKGAREELSQGGREISFYGTTELAALLQEQGRGAEAEAILAHALAQKGAAANSGWGMDNRPALLKALAGLYHKNGLHQDVMTLLNEAPQWGAPDLIDLDSLQYRRAAGCENNSLIYIAATALAETGDKDTARKLLGVLLEANPGCDSAYELLLKLEGDAAMPKLDALFAMDQFEERPLIWKAVLLLRAKKLEEAEQVVRQGIAIDPSDGEQGAGDRMRAYAVLADIREARGDQKQADFFREVVKAIRLSERADRFYEAGLLKQAIKMYEDSLTHFADAYCIQSRLALRMAELGLHDKAEEHYRRAYELMPDSFGRVESHCFGCENAFSGERAQGIAEKIFSDLAKKTPNKPQVHYLLGYLREEQGRHREALTHFQEAVALDPQYLNAWKQIAGIGGLLRLPAAQRDAVAFNLLRLDPRGRHVDSDYRNITDLKALWKAVDSAQHLQSEPPKSLYVLAASKAELDKKKTDANRESWERHHRFSRETKMSAAGAVLQNQIVQSVAVFLTQPME